MRLLLSLQHKLSVHSPKKCHFQELYALFKANITVPSSHRDTGNRKLYNGEKCNNDSIESVIFKLCIYCSQGFFF